MVEARSLRVALNARLHALSAGTVFAPAEATVTRTASDRAVVQIAGGPAIHLPAGGGRRGARVAAAPRRPASAVSRLAYRQAGIVSAVAHERPHRGAALEHFLPAGPFAQLPMTGTA